MFPPSSTTSAGCAGAGTATLQDCKHKAAIALNNNAVTLLVRGCHHEALATFKDSMKLIKSASRDRTDPVSHSTAEDIRLALHQARKRTTRCKNTTGPNASTNGLMLQVVSSQCNTASIYAALSSSRGDTLNVAYPLTIDPIDFEDSDDDDIDFQSCVILFNYGIAYNCLAVTSDDSVKTLLQEKSYHMFYMTSVVLSKLYQNVQADALTYAASRLLLLKTFLTHSLIQASIKLDSQFEYEEHCKTMEGLLRVMGVQQLILPLADHCLAAAA
jgi:hypothetical protein